jgi:hypothetical protein
MITVARACRDAVIEGVEAHHISRTGASICVPYGRGCEGVLGLPHRHTRRVLRVHTLRIAHSFIHLHAMALAFTPLCKPAQHLDTISYHPLGRASKAIFKKLGRPRAVARHWLT